MAVQVGGRRCSLFRDGIGRSKEARRRIMVGTVTRLGVTSTRRIRRLGELGRVFTSVLYRLQKTAAGVGRVTEGLRASKRVPGSDVLCFLGGGILGCQGRDREV